MLSEAAGKVVQTLLFIRPPRMHDNGHKDMVEKVTGYNDRLHRWRTAVALWLLTCVITIASYIAYAEGRLPFAAGYATQEEVRDLKGQIDRVEIRQMENTLLTTRASQCQAIRTGRDQTFYADRLNELMREYKRLTGDAWRLPDCSELIPPSTTP